MVGNDYFSDGDWCRKEGEENPSPDPEASRLVRERWTSNTMHCQEGKNKFLIEERNGFNLDSVFSKTFNVGCLNIFKIGYFDSLQRPMTWTVLLGQKSEWQGSISVRFCGFLLFIVYIIGNHNTQLLMLRFLPSEYPFKFCIICIDFKCGRFYVITYNSWFLVFLENLEDLANWVSIREWQQMATACSLWSPWWGLCSAVFCGWSQPLPFPIALPSAQL